MKAFNESSNFLRLTVTLKTYIMARVKRSKILLKLAVKARRGVLSAPTLLQVRLYLANLEGFIPSTIIQKLSGLRAGIRFSIARTRSVRQSNTLEPRSLVTEM